MKMSHLHTWELVESMNKQTKIPLVEITTDGKGGDVARLKKRRRKCY